MSLGCWPAIDWLAAEEAIDIDRSAQAWVIGEPEEARERKMSQNSVIVDMIERIDRWMDRMDRFSYG